MTKVPNSVDAGDDDVKELAKQLGVDLDDNGDGTDENESNSSEKTDTETTEEVSRGGKSEKESVDYKAKYAASTKEVQETFLPLQKKVKTLEEKYGKSLDDILGTVEEKKTEEPQKDTSKDKDEVAARVLSMETELKQIKEKVTEHDTAAQIAAREKKDAFLQKYELSEDAYASKIQPKLNGISKMTKENGEPYKLEEGLEMAYLLANVGNLDKIVEKKAQLLKKQIDLGGFSPTGAKESSSIGKPEFNEAQLEAAKHFGINLKEDKK
jgi:hypothetical protein